MTIDEIRRVVREELGKGEGVDLEFAELVKVETGDSGEPMEIDCAHERPSYCQATDDFEKMFQREGQELRKHDVVRSRMAPARQETESEEQSCEEFFGECEKRSSSPHKIKLTKRLVDGELLIEGWDAAGTCVMTRVVPAGEEVHEGEPLAKSAISSAMRKTLDQLRTKLTAEEIKLAEKAIAALDPSAFLAIIRGELYAASEREPMDAKTHFKKSAEQHQAMSDHHGNLVDECEEAELDGMAKEHRALQKVHAERAAHYTAMHESATRKAVEDEMAKNRNALQPSAVSGIVPDNPNVRAVPRFGQKPVAKTDVDEEFAFLAKVQTGDEE